MHPTRFMHILLLLVLTAGFSARANGDDGPFQATGFKVGEVSDTTAIVWTRLSRRENRNPSDGPMFTIKYANSQNERIEAIEYPDGVTVDDIQNAAPGTGGEVRVLYRRETERNWSETAWRAVDPEADFTRQFRLTGLLPNTRYVVKVESKAATNGAVTNGGDKAAFVPHPVRRMQNEWCLPFQPDKRTTIKTCPAAIKIYPSMLKLDPSFFVHTGDIVYYDKLAKTKELAHYHWQRTYSLPTNVDFHRQVASYFIKDDHDAWQNDCWPTMKNSKMFQFTFAEGLEIFRQQVPMGERTYRTYRWGKDLQVWLVEGRDFRSPNNMPDGPNKTIWGAEQMQWFKQTVQQSEATFRVLISPTPVVGPDRDNKHDNHSNKDFAHEGNQLRDFIASQKNMVVVCGDRHWQYMSIDPRTNVREYSCGPASDKHAGGWKQSDFRKDYHQYLNVIGGFLSATVDRQDDVAKLTFRYHDVDGVVKYEDVISQ